MIVTVTLRKTVPDTVKANEFIAEVRELMKADNDVTIGGFLSKQLDDPPAPPT